MASCLPNNNNLGVPDHGLRSTSAAHANPENVSGLLPGTRCHWSRTCISGARPGPYFSPTAGPRRRITDLLGFLGWGHPRRVQQATCLPSNISTAPDPTAERYPTVFGREWVIVFSLTYHGRWPSASLDHSRNMDGYAGRVLLAFWPVNKPTALSGRSPGHSV